MAKKASLAKTTDSWEDSLGQKIEPGDFVAVATISGRSPQMVVAQIERLNTHDKDGKPFGAYSKSYPATASDESDFLPRTHTRYDGTTYTSPAHIRTITLTCAPLFDGRGFSRGRGKYVYDAVTGKWGHDGSTKVRSTTYRVVGNIIKLDTDQVFAMLEKQELEQLEKDMENA